MALNFAHASPIAFWNSRRFQIIAPSPGLIWRPTNHSTFGFRMDPPVSLSKSRGVDLPFSPDIYAPTEKSSFEVRPALLCPKALQYRRRSCGCSQHITWRQVKRLRGQSLCPLLASRDEPIMTAVKFYCSARKFFWATPQCSTRKVSHEAAPFSSEAITRERILRCPMRRERLLNRAR